MNKEINAQLFRRMIVGAAGMLMANRKEVDELNVFPVPDGDTGTNMSLTVNGAMREVEKLPEDASVADTAKALSSGALRGARGNSGVIVSQLFRGMNRALREVEVIRAANLAEALSQGVDTAYKAVMRPKEGTILTVAKACSQAALEAAHEEDDLEEVLRQIIERGEKVLAETPEMLPVLKEAGVVDAGGKGLLYIYRGMYAVLLGMPIEGSQAEENKQPVENHEAEPAERPNSAQAFFDTESIRFGYCTEFIVHCANAEAHEDEMRTYLSGIGDSLVVVADDDIIKIHVHSNDPGLAIQKGLEFGYLTNMKIDNMRIQHQNLVITEQEPQQAPALHQTPVEKPRKKYGFVAVSMGEGLSEIFRELGVDEVISGGQTMNPSTEDILNAANRVNAECVIVLPNNKNIILAAEQAASLVADKQIVVISTRNVPQGISAMVSFNPEADPEENRTAMEEAILEVHTGVTTYAIRDTHLNEFEIHKDDILGMFDGEMSVVGTDPLEVARQLIDQMLAMDKEFFTVYYGQESSEESAQSLADYILEKVPEAETEIYNGGQPLYHFLISAE